MVDEATLSLSDHAAPPVLGYTTASLSRLHATEAQATACVDAWCIISVVLNLLCSGEPDASRPVSYRSLLQSRSPSVGLIMKRILWPATKHARVASNGSKTKSVRRRVVESVIQSAAIYSVASISFGITSFLSPDIGFPICHSLFPPVIVSFPLRPQ